MKIEKLTLQDFKCFEDLKIQFTKPVNLIFGGNASGKSTIAQAIALALTGRINGGCDRHPLVRHVAEEFAVSLFLSQNGAPGHLQRYEMTQLTSAKESTDPETLFQGLKTNRDTLAALLETANFLNLHPDEKKRMLFDLLPGLKVDVNTMPRHLAAWLKDQPDLLKKYRLDPAEDLMKILTSCTSLEDAYNQAYEERRIARRELKIIGDCPRLPRGLTKEALETSLNDKRRELSALYVAVGETKGMAEGERKQIERESSRIVSELNQLETFLQEADPEALQERLDDQERRRLTLTKEIQVLKDSYAAFQRETGKLLVQKEQEESRRSQAKAFNGRCPAFPEVTCRTKEVTSRIAAASSGNAELAAAIETQSGKTKDLFRHLQENEAALNEVSGGIVAVKNSLSRVAESRKKLQDLRAKRQELAATLSAVNEDKVAAAQKIREQITVLEGAIREETNLLASLEKAERIRTLEGRADKLEVLTLAFSPRGIMSSLMKGAATNLMTLANGLMADLTGHRYALEIDFEEGFRIFLCDYEKSAHTEVGLISASERFRVAVVMQAVLSELAGLRFMVIDGIDVLDQANRGFFFQFLRKVLPRFDQIIGFCTVGQQAPKNPGLPDVDFFILDDRQVKQIAA
ncbi:MAG: hypothetical protein C0394_10870 [Syntrophus sp. (in: bacteria)]|nr:hypothetical protein [Syntrophus sp. (in: bacteria)]